MSDVLSIDLLDAASGLETDTLLAMMPRVSTSRPTSVLIEAIWNEATHPRWPPGAKDPDGHNIGGQFMRAGQTFMHDGQRWDIHSIADGKIIANEASGDIDKVETRVFTPSQVKFDDGEHPSLKGATVAPPVVLTAGKSSSASGKEGFTAPIVDGHATPHDHDPSIPLPEGSKLTADDWKNFGLADQLYYRELMKRYGAWTPTNFHGAQSSKVAQVFSKAKQEFGDSDAESIVVGAIGGQKGSSKGYELNLVTLFKGMTPGSPQLKLAQKRYARAREVQSEINGVIAYDLYNRLKAPDISVRHKAPNKEGFFGNIVKGKHAVMSGLSTAWTTAFNWGEPNTLGFAMPVRHIALAEQVTGMGWGANSGENELATADRLKVTPDSSAFWSLSQVPEKPNNPLWKWLKTHMDKKPAAGHVMKAFAAHLSGKEDLPDVVAEPNFELKQHGVSDQYVIPPDEFMQHVEHAVAENPGKVISEKLPVSELNLKPGDVFEGSTEGLRYMVIDDPGLPHGTIRYVALGKGAAGNYDSPPSEFGEGAKLYTTAGSRKKVDLHFDIPAPKVKEEGPRYDSNDWVPSGETVKLNTLQVGDKVRYDGEDWEITNQSSTITTVKSLTSKKEGTFNPLWKTQALKSAAAAKPTMGSLMKYQNMVVRVDAENADKPPTYHVTALGSGSAIPTVAAGDLSPLESFHPTSPEKGDTFAHEGKKFSITSVLKNGTVKAKPSGGKVESFAPDHDALKGLVRPSSYKLGDKSKLKDMQPGDLFSGSANTVRPYMKLSSVHAQNLDTGEVVTLSPNKSYSKLGPVTASTPEEAPTTGKEWGDVHPAEQKFKVGDKLAGFKYGDLEVGDKFGSAGSLYTVTGNDANDPNVYNVTYTGGGATGDTKVTKTSPIYSASTYMGHEQIPGAEAPGTHAKIAPGDQLKNWDQVHVGAIVQFTNLADVTPTYKVVGDDGDAWVLDEIGKPNGVKAMPWLKNTPAPASGLVYLGDDEGALTKPKLEVGQTLGPIKYGDLQVGDKFTHALGNSYIMGEQDPDAPSKVTLYSAANGNKFSVPKTSTIGSSNTYQGMATPDEIAKVMPTAKVSKGVFTVGEPMGSHLMKDLKVGDQFTTGSGAKYQVTSTDGEVKIAKVLSNGLMSPELHHGYQLDSTISENWKFAGSVAPPEPAAPQAGEPKDAISDGSFKPYKSNAGPGNAYKHDKLKDMMIGALFVDSGGKAWKVISKQPDDKKVTLSDGKAFYTADDKLRGKLAVHSKKPVDFKDEMGAAAPEAKPAPSSGAPPKDVMVGPSDLEVGDLFQNASGGQFEVTGVNQLTVSFKKLSGAGSPTGSLSKGSAMKYKLVAKGVPDNWIKAPEDSSTSSGLSTVQSLGLPVGSQFTSPSGAKWEILGTKTTPYGGEKYELKNLGTGKTAYLKTPTVLSYKLPEPKAKEGPMESNILPAPFRPSGTPSASTALLSPHSLAAVGGHVFYKTENPDVSSQWVQLGNDEYAQMPALVQQVHPQLPDVSNMVQDLDKPLDLKTLTPGTLFMNKDGHPYMVLGQGSGGTHAISLENKNIGFQPSAAPKTVYGLKAKPEGAPEPEPAAVPVPEGFKSVPGGVNAKNAGLQPGDEFLDDDGDHHKVVSVDPGTSVTTMYSQPPSMMNLGPSVWHDLDVTAIKKGPGNDEPAGPEIPKGEHWEKLATPTATGSLNLKVGDQVIDSDGDVHTVTDVNPAGGLTTTWTKPNGKQHGPMPWGTQGLVAVGVNKAPAEPPPAAGGDKEVPDYTGTVLVGGTAAGGTTGAQIKTAPDGKKWLLKTYDGNEDRVASELLANAVYREMGLSAAEAGKFENKGKLALAYPLVDGEQTHFSAPGESSKKIALGKGFMTDVLVANRDFAGLVDDNVLWNGDEPTRIDQGGTFFYRAQGAAKDFDPDPAEDLIGFLTKGQGKLGVSVTEAGLRAQAAKIAETMTPEKIDSLVAQAGFANKKMEEDVRTSLHARRNWMQHFGAGSIPLPAAIDIPKGVESKPDESKPDGLGGSIPKFDLPVAEPESSLKMHQPLGDVQYGDLAVGDTFLHVAGDHYVVTAQDGGKTTLANTGTGKAFKLNSDSYVGNNKKYHGKASPAVLATANDIAQQKFSPAKPETAGYSTPVEGTKVDMPIEPYTSKWASGGKFAYSHIADLQPGQKFADKKGKVFTVTGVIKDKQHSGQTPASGPDNTTFAYSDDHSDFIAIPHTFTGQKGAKAGKTLPTRVKLVS